MQTVDRPFATQVSTDKISRGGSADAHFFGVTDTEGRTLSLDGLKAFELRCVYDTEAVAPGVDLASAMGQDLRSEMCEVMCGPLPFPPFLVHILTAQCHAGATPASHCLHVWQSSHVIGRCMQCTLCAV